MENKHTIGDLHQMQSLPLSAKIAMTKYRIREWYEHWDGNVYVSFSGGKDSTVLLHLVRSMYPDVKAMFIDTGLEYPEVREFVKTIDNVDIVKPKYTFKQVLKNYGYPFPSKEVSDVVQGAKKYIDKVAATNRLAEQSRAEQSRAEQSESRIPTTIEDYLELANMIEGDGKITWNWRI